MKKSQLLRYVQLITLFCNLIITYVLTCNIIIASNYDRTKPDVSAIVFDYTKANFEAMNEYITNTLILCHSSSDVEFV